MLNIDAIAHTPVRADPFPHFVVRDVLTPGQIAGINNDFPDIRDAGIFPVSELKFGPSFAQLIADVEGSELEAVMAEKYQLDLSGKPLMVTVRGFCRARDGRIHNDSKDKAVTCLLYLNPGEWAGDGGRLRLLYDNRNLDNAIAEIPPNGGTFVSFKRTENSWHGHERFEGRRRYIMFNWMTSETTLAKNVGRHKISAAFKRLFGSEY